MNKHLIARLIMMSIFFIIACPVVWKFSPNAWMMADIYVKRALYRPIGYDNIRTCGYPLPPMTYLCCRKGNSRVYVTFADDDQIRLYMNIKMQQSGWVIEDRMGAVRYFQKSNKKLSVAKQGNRIRRITVEL